MAKHLPPPPISVREKLVAVTGALTLGYTAWGFGGMFAWSLHTMLVGGLLTLAIALQPFGGVRDQKSPLRRLLRFPGTYFAIAFLLYLAIGGLNPAWQTVWKDTSFHIEQIDPPLASWLPTSLTSPYEMMNVWRTLNMHLAAFALALGLYCGLSRRSTTSFVLWFLVINVTAMAVVAIIQHMTGTDSVLIIAKSHNKHFWGSFFYRNHGAAYLNWGLVIAGCLFFYHANRTRRAGRSGGPHFLLFCFIGIIAASVGLALSRGGILFAGILSGFFVFLVILSYLRNATSMPATSFLTITALLFVLLGAGIYQTYHTIDWEAVEERFGDIEATIQNADQDQRALATKATWAMAQDQLWTGWGGGSFRYAFPIYQQEISELFFQYKHRRRGWVGRRFFHYAHNDIVQFIAEYGVIGTSILLLFLLCFLIPALVGSFSAGSVFLTFGFIAALGHAFVEFIFHSPSYWVAFLTGIALVTRLLQLDRRSS